MAGRADRKTPRDWLRLVFRRRNLFLLGSSLAALAVLVLTNWIPPRYTGVAKYYRITSLPNRSAETIGPYEALKKTLEQDLAGPDAVQQVVEELGLTKDLPRDRNDALTTIGRMKLQDIVKKVRDNLELRWETNAVDVDMVAISYTDRDPRLAESIPNRLKQNYVNRVTSQIRELLKGRWEQLKKQVEDTDSRLKEARKKRSDFERQHPQLLELEILGLYAELQRAQAAEEAAKQAVVQAQRRLARLQQELVPGATATAPAASAPVGLAAAPASAPGASGPATLAASMPAGEPSQVMLMPNPARTQLLTEREQAVRGLQELTAVRGLKEQHPLVIEAQARIKQLDEMIANASEYVEIPVYEQGVPESVRVQLTVAETEVDDAKDALALAHRRVEEISARMGSDDPLVRQNYEELQHQEAALEKELENRTEEFRRVTEQWTAETSSDPQNAGNAVSGGTRFPPSQNAEEQFRPSYPTLLMVFGAAIIGGLAFGVGLVFLSNSLDRTIVSTEDASRHFDVPVYGVISEIVSPEQRRRRTLRRWTLGPAITVVMVLALLLASLHDVLWLRDRPAYNQWKRSPAGFLYDRGVRPAERWLSDMAR